MLKLILVESAQNQPNLTTVAKTRFYGTFNSSKIKRTNRTFRITKRTIKLSKSETFPKLQGEVIFFARRTNFFCKVLKNFFQGERNFQSPFLGPKSGIFQDYPLKNTATAFSMLRKTKIDFELEKRSFQGEI
ncbi:MAG: hypothetical protein NC224_05800, partial [Bacteroides sp.]|nr:hypothetical protein [Bacteroides sp.]